jgi:hypothetical protein
MRPGGADGARRASPRNAVGSHPARAALLVIVAVAVTVVLLTRLGGGVARSTVASSNPGSGSGSSANTTTTTTTPTTTTTVSTIPASKIELQVLNGLQNGPLSAEWSAKLHSAPGYETMAARNTTTEDTISAIYIVKSGYQAEAEALARTVGLPDSSIVDVIPPPSSAPIPAVDLQQADLVLVIGDSLASKA